MLGFSVYLKENIDFKKEVEKNRDLDLVFTSLNYQASEENFEEFLKLYELCKENNIEICVDINDRILKDHPQLVDMSLTLRLDFGFSSKQISELSKSTNLAINASTVDKKLLQSLENYNTRMDKIFAIHNFYPLEYSGLSEIYFIEQNELIRSFGIKIGAFIAGNDRLRGPVFNGLPSLEDDRYKNPYLSFIKLERKYELDMIFLAETILDRDMSYIKRFLNNGVITLPVYLDDDYKDLEAIKVRPDISEYIIRNERIKMDVNSTNPTEIRRGDVVILNNLSGRYSGEIELVKKYIGSNKQRNVIGRVDKDYEEILDYIKGGDIIEFDRR
ncbi:MupG family TIM beta-alpha barrel fold protein [uncultured Anaerococcus sp.]|uniref:MupG family TIM beta-alpha barrel fold protein n=1 Tax=uncultured Anaerococcus sp. TaxID=293428 RepID=UPI00260E17BE|nr:MupG family TIM beta-alpha barrel fold protein [uncultured Anaerococcus sp.]